MAIALISKLSKQQKEAFWQWYPGYGYARPNYNTMEDRSRKEVFGMHLNEDEIPFEEGDLPERFFEDTRRAPPAERVIPTVPDFVAEDRPTPGKACYPEFKQQCSRASTDIERIIEEDWIDIAGSPIRISMATSWLTIIGESSWEMLSAKTHLNRSKWFQHPIWRLGQARVGNGPYTLAGEHHEPITRSFEVPNQLSLPDVPSKVAYQKYRALLDAWQLEVTIPVNTPRPLGAPACGPEWDEQTIKNAFMSTTGITPNMLEWIVESALEEAIKHPHPSNMKLCYHRTSIPESKHIARVGWVRWSVHRGSLPTFARHPCRPFRIAGACADPAMVQVIRALGNVPRAFRCYETNALFCVGLICSSSSDAPFEAAASEGGVFANPTRTRFWRVVLSNTHPGLQGNSPGNHKSCYELLRPFQTLSASMLDCVSRTCFALRLAQEKG
eukprot:2230323-Amphidinium_carterae.2